MHGYGYDWMPGYGYGMGGFFMVLVWLVLIIGIGAVVVWVMRGGRAARADIPSTALQILEERYARGEIGREEFLAKKKDLES